MNIKNLSDFIKVIREIQEHDSSNENEYYYRGHSDIAYELLPSIYRKTNAHILNNEDSVFKEVIIRTPTEFDKEKTTFEKLVKMQHYGLPTRLLDVTSNAVVSLYFSCLPNESNKDGQVIIFKIPRQHIKYYDGGSVAILSNLARLSTEFKIPDIDLENSTSSMLKKFNDDGIFDYLFHCIRQESPQFTRSINPKHFSSVLPVKAKLNNNRILKQSGAFLLFGIKKEKNQPAEVPESWILNKMSDDFDIIVPSANKQAILQELNAIGINESTLMPELEQQAKHVWKMFNY